ncbi:protein fam207a-like [Plakobranchus ocellatus]|uniref:Protein fam207a-like n=1 Tax=Plakobranchus ocellatus TaxID=259542 RepID=A0AAV4D2Z1_9GAST|nr:protein fam207a-like [Plakobranchus ocellatus]
MGKMKRMRQKLHIAAAKSKDKDKSNMNSNNNVADQPMEDAQFKLPIDPTALGARGENLFKDVKISSLDLTPQKLPDLDARSTITSKTFRGQNLTKKEKQKMRRDAWMAKMDAITSAKNKAKEKKKKQQTPIVGDMTEMEEALPTLELLMKKPSQAGAKRDHKEKERPIPKEKKRKKQIDHKEKERPIPKEKKRKKQMHDDISLFHRVLEHPLFKEDASNVIKTHLKNKIQMEKEMETS